MFVYKDNILALQQGDGFRPVQDIAKGQSVPFYLYDIQGIKERYRFFKKATNHRLHIFFAMKANFNKEVLKALQKEGSGVDVVSLGEADCAQEAGFSPQKIIFSGVGKSAEELSSAVERGFFQVNGESLEELKRLAKICRQKNKTCSIGLRINPNVDFSAHPYIKTGLSGHKFGFEEGELPVVLDFVRSQNLIRLQGLSIHLGSQIFDLKPLFKAIKRLKDLYSALRGEYPLKVLDFGGGLAVNYQNSDLEEEKARIKDFGQGLSRLLEGFDGLALIEPGRSLTARFGILCAQVEYIKKSSGKQFVILNSGMNHFLRPALYGAKHRILPFKQSKGSKQSYDVVGPLCETADTIAKDCLLPELKSGDWLALADTGAYGFVMANQYNLRPSAREISFDEGKQL